MKRRVVVILCVLLMLAMESLVAADIDNLLVVLPGTIQGALGGADWAPGDRITQMQPKGNGVYEFIAVLPKGYWEYKVAINGSWSENYGLNGVPHGPNIPLVVPEDNYQVRFVFDYKTKEILDSINSGIKPYPTPQQIRIIGLNIKDNLMKPVGEDLYELKVRVPRGLHSYRVQYDGSDQMIYGYRGQRQGEGIPLVLTQAQEVTFYHDLATNTTWDSVNYIPVEAERIPTIKGEGFADVAMEDNDKDNIYRGQVRLPAGKRKYTFNIYMGAELVGTKTIHFNEVAGNYPVTLTYDLRTKELSCDYIETLAGLDGKVVAASLYYNSRDHQYKTPFGAVPQGTEVTFTLSAKANDLERARIVIAKEKIHGNREKIEYLEQVKYPMQKVGLSTDKSRELWQVTVRFTDMSVYGYYFEAVDGKETVVYANNTQPINIVNNRILGTGGVGSAYVAGDDRIIWFKQTVYDPEYQTPDWAKDAVIYYIFPERFKNGDKANDPVPGVTKFYGNRDIEFHKNWLDKPWVPGNADGNTTDDDEWCNDFFGGDLAGIRQKLDYLKDLGINTIYLNPIFEAPSNHKYDTADYHRIDDNFGTEEEFAALVAEAKARGIRIILDTSLNHSGSDSIYMDRYGKYSTDGAFEKEKINKNSPYYDWYEFVEGATNPDQAYQQWANPTLANLKESDSYKNFAYRDEDSVTKYWLKKGIGGWRMDVTPWVTDEFWREWRREVKATNPDAITIAETWFDASKYFLGDMFDSTMNYIFRQAMLDYANGQRAQETLNVLEMTREHYPPQAYYALMNLISSHDVPRALFEYGYKDEGESPDVIELAKRKLKLTVFFQMTYPGAPAIYYGDEVGVTGGEDPFNRGTYPWKEDGGNPDEELLAEVKRLVALRNKYAVLRRGSVEPIYVDNHVIVFWREDQDQVAVVAVSNAPTAQQVKLDLQGLKLPATFVDALNGEELTARNGVLTLTVPPYYGRVLIAKK